MIYVDSKIVSDSLVDGKLSFSIFADYCVLGDASTSLVRKFMKGRENLTIIMDS